MSSFSMNTTSLPAAAANTNEVTIWIPHSHNVNKRARVVSYEEENSLDENGISIWLSFAFKNITPERVFHCLKKARLSEGEEPIFLGIIIRIDQVLRMDGNKMFFVHFAQNSWSTTNKAKWALNKL